jgi:hypothetical protein
MRTRFWIILFAALAVAALAASLFVSNRSHTERIAGVYSDGKLVRTIRLDEVTEPYAFTVPYGDGYNTIYVSKEGIWITDASCPDKLCIDHGPLGDGPPIVCLPNRLVIRWETRDEPKYDAMTGI